MKPSEIQNAVAGIIKTRYPTMTVEPHGGNFTERDVPMLLAKAPAILVACTVIPAMQPAGLHRWRTSLQWALFVLGADTATTERDVVAMDTVFDLLLWLPTQRWDVPNAGLIEHDSMTANNLYTGSLNNLRIALWGMRWNQPFTFEE